MDFEFPVNSLVQWVDIKIHGLSHTRPVTRLCFPVKEAGQNLKPKEKSFPFLLALFPPSDKPRYSLAVFQQHPDAQLH